MKPLGKALKMAHHNKLDKKQELNRFLKNYRATPHPSTGFAPGDVMFRAGFKTGPRRLPPVADIVEKVKRRDKASKSKNFQYVNSKRFTSRRNLAQGQLVLLKNDFRTRKFEPYFENEPYLILEKVGELLTLFRCSDGRSVQRHTSKVKPFFPRRRPPGTTLPHTSEPQLSDLEDEELETALVAEHPPTVGPGHPDPPQVPDPQQPVPAPQTVPPVALPDVAAPVRRSERLRTDTRDTKFKDFAT